MEVYKPPKSELGATKIPKREKLGKVLSFLSFGSLFMAVGTVNTIVQFIESFNHLKENAVDPKMMSGLISQNLVPMVLGVITSLPSLICIFLAIFLTTYRSKLFFKFWVFVALTFLISFPFGSIFGVLLGLLLFFKRKEF